MLLISRTIIIIGITISLSACAHKENGQTDLSLTAFDRISYTYSENTCKSDTIATIKQIREHNAVFEALEAIDR